MCMVSIDPVTSSDESTQFAAKCVDVIAPSAIIVPDIAFVAISSDCTLVRAIYLFIFLRFRSLLFLHFLQ